MHQEGIPVFIALLPVLAIILMFLSLDRTFSLRRELTRGFSLRQLFYILLTFAVGGGIVATYVAQYHPELFLEFPRQRPDTYLRIMLLYPLMSVLVQELVYRTFFFHRYGVLFGRAWWLAIVLNGVLFGLGHIVIGTPLADLWHHGDGHAVRLALRHDAIVLGGVPGAHAMGGAGVHGRARPLLLHRRRHLLAWR